MSRPIKLFYATNLAGIDEIFLSEWKPAKYNGQWIRPPGTTIGNEMWIPNVLDLKEFEGSVPVRIIKSEEETGLWLICYNDYFIDEQHLYNFKPRFSKDKPDRLDSEYMSTERNKNSNFWELHVESDQEMKAGEGPISATLKRISSDIAEGLVIGNGN